MDKKLTPKIVVIIILVVAAFLTLYPPSETLKPGIDLAGGTSLIYEIDAYDLAPAERKDLAARMITVLRRRIDPANIQNLVWRPQGNTRFEIQMPLATAEARQKRADYENLKKNLLDDNINTSKIIRCLEKPLEQRTQDFNDFAKGSEERLTILKNLAAAYDERQDLRKKRDELTAQLEVPESAMTLARIDVEQVKFNRVKWAGLNQEQLKQELTEFLDGAEPNLSLLTDYVKLYANWADVADQLTDPNTGKNAQYKEAQKAIDQLNLSEDQIDRVLEMPQKSAQRKEIIEQLKATFADRVDKIDRLVRAFDEYRPFQGRLDDPRDLQRMLKGAGILEFRILPTKGHPEVDMDEMLRYEDTLKAQGPKYASDNRYMWCEIEQTPEGWRAADEQNRPSIVAQFGDKLYVLAGNQTGQTMLHGTAKDWKLEKAKPGVDQSGRRAIDFRLNDRGGNLFFALTSKNVGRPLCILLDGVAISAPFLKSKIRTQGKITGRFSQKEVEDMVLKLNAGSLPARLIEQPISVKTIGPSIGADNRTKGIRAGIIGLVVVIFCMGVYYLLAGSIADGALLMNILMVLAAMALLRATFTLPGIAGIILTIGMSVDANVLIFERIREEQQRGSSLRIAIRNGYQRAFRTIFDANLTTFITAAILFWVASEEVKGFAIVLMLGIASSMFTALFVTRVIFDILLAKRVIKDHLVMLRLIHQPNVNWMALRPVFFCVSALLIASGLLVFFTRDNTVNNKYDIEFTGGTSAQINLKENVILSRQQVEDIIRNSPAALNNPALRAARVYSIGQSEKQYEINTTETNKTSVTIKFAPPGQHTPETMISKIRALQTRQAGRLNNLNVTPLDQPGDFAVTTSQVNKTLVKSLLTNAFPDAEISEPQVDEIVNRAILEAFAGKLEIQQSLKPQIASEEKIDEKLIEAAPELADFIGGIKITCKIAVPATGAQIERRFGDLRFKPDMRDLNWGYDHVILDADLNELQPDRAVDSFVYVSAEQDAGLREISEDEWERFSQNERQKVLAAAQLETSLPRVTQIDPSVGAEAKTRAMIAVVLSLFAIVAYIWVRFGNLRYGLAAIMALVHDVCITLGAVTACTYIASSEISKSTSP
ncbi:MAG: protein translocase subunit SecD [Planctomycetota bacterium]|jgi:SecD/SecF fusion protein